MRVAPIALIAQALGLALPGCGSESTHEADAAPQTADPKTDKLAQILARGTLVGYRGGDYPPQSMDVKGAERRADTKCAPTQLTAIIQAAQADGTLTRLSRRFFGRDSIPAAAGYDIDAIGQEVK